MTFHGGVPLEIAYYQNLLPVLNNTEGYIHSGVLSGLNGVPQAGLLFECRRDASFALNYTDGGMGEGRSAVKEDIAALSAQLGISLQPPAQGYQIWQRPGPQQAYKGSLPYQMDGFDPVCSQSVMFTAKSNWFRDNLISRCRTMPRERALAFVLANLISLDGKKEALRIHESSPNPFGLSAQLKTLFGSNSYKASQYSPKISCGDPIDGSSAISLDLEQQSCIQDASFDIVVTQDVFEHIYNPKRAFAEIARTLQPGGFHIFTVPITSKSYPTFVAAERAESGDVLLHAPPEIHGNPMGAGGSLLTHQWGFDIVNVIQEASGMETYVIYVNGEIIGVNDAEYREIFVSRKPLTNGNFPHMWKILDALVKGGTASLGPSWARNMITCNVQHGL